MYDPTTGTFLTRDPLDGVDGTTTVANPYHYVLNDPLNLADPMGLRPSESPKFSVTFEVSGPPCGDNSLRQVTADHAAGIYQAIVGGDVIDVDQMLGLLTGGSPHTGWTIKRPLRLSAMPWARGKYCNNSAAFWTGENLTGAFVVAGAMGGPSAEAAEAAAQLGGKAAAARSALSAGGRRNVAIVAFSVDEATGELRTVSGQAPRPGSVGMPETPRYTPKVSGGFLRNADAEYKLIEELAATIGPPSESVSGTVAVYSEQAICSSCQSVISAFGRDYPNLTVKTFSGKGSYWDFVTVFTGEANHGG